MPHEEKLRNPSERKPESTSVSSADLSPVLDATTELVEGRINEVAPNLSEKASSQNPQSQQQTQTTRTDDPALTDREVLRKRLLSQAPKETLMRAEVRTVLEKEVQKLEGDIASFRRKRQYHLLSAAVMRLRIAMKQLEELARLGLEQLKEAWLRVVHHFA